MPGRKVVGPSPKNFVWPPHALPSFGWWTFDCGRMPDGGLLDVVGQARPSIEAHLLPVRLAWRQAAGWPQRLQSQRAATVERAREALVEGSLEGVDQLLGGLAIPGLGLGVSWLRRSAAVVSRRRKEQGALRGSTQLMPEVAASQQSAAKEVAELVTAIAHPSVPAIIVVEDLHLMSPDFADFLEVAAARRAGRPVLIIGTAWPEGLHNPPFDHWRRWANVHGNLGVWKMPDLGQDDLLTLFYSYAPNTEASVARSIVERYPNPLMLQLFCTLDDIEERIRDDDGRLDLTADELADLPHTLQGMYEARWAELPKGVQDALKAAAGTIPDPRFPYLPPVVAAAAEAAGVTNGGEEILTNLKRATRDFAWSVDGDLAEQSQFREPILGEIALGHVTRTRRERLQGAAREELGRRIDLLRGSSYLLRIQQPEVVHLARWLTALTRPDSKHSIAESTAAIVAAHAVGAAHQPAAAAATLTERAWSGPLDPDHPDTLLVRNNIASWLAEAGKLDEAIDQFAQVLIARERTLGADHQATLNSRHNLATWRAEAGKLDEAIAVFTELLSDETRILGADHSETLTTRNNLASCFGRNGQLKEAIEMSTELLSDQERILGPDHPDTLITRNNLANWLADSGKFEETIGMFTELLAERERILGPEHPATLLTRHNLASNLGRNGQIQEAIDLSSELLKDQRRILGPDHPNTLLTRNNLANWLAEAGALDEALDVLTQLLSDQQRILGPDHPSTLLTRNNLGACLGWNDQVDEASEVFSQVLLDRERILGANHPDTLVTRSNLAVCLSRSGRIAEAIELQTQLLSDRERILGPDHPSTLFTQRELGYLREQQSD
jgi:tetratricopeptide (TPR) repeat protein